MANAGCINAIGFDGTYLRTLQCLDSSNIGVGVQYTAPNPLDDKRFDYITYTDKCGCQCCLTDENEILIYATQGVIKNLTLTNDDTNEKVIVKWTDLFGSNWAKTVVRYKTGSYPSSPTDGTLAVEETTQNQYQTNGYSVSGLEDGITYYFSVFALDGDGTTINVQSMSIIPEFRSFRYIRWNIQSLQGADQGKYVMQASEFELLIGTTKRSRPSGITASTNATAWGNNEGVGNLIDGVTSTKFCPNNSSWTRPLYAEFDLQQNVDLKNITNRRRYNGNDTASYSMRNPSSGNISVSRDGINWKIISVFTSSESKNNSNYGIAYTGTIDWNIT